MSVATERPELPRRQAQVLGFIVAYREAHGYSPSIREIGDEFGIHSPNGVICHLRSLVKKRYLATDATCGRVLVPLSEDGTRLPLRRSIASMRQQLSERQSRILGYILETIEAKGYAPTTREIMQRFEFASPNGATVHLKALDRKGWIIMVPNVSRGIVLTQAPITNAEPE